MDQEKAVGVASFITRHDHENHYGSRAWVIALPEASNPHLRSGRGPCLDARDATFGERHE